jgi:hypothetical protein
MPRFVGAFFVSQLQAKECPDESGHSRLKGLRYGTFTRNAYSESPAATSTY